jgi:hypothetical protein
MKQYDDLALTLLAFPPGQTSPVPRRHAATPPRRHAATPPRRHAATPPRRHAATPIMEAGLHRVKYLRPEFIIFLLIFSLFPALLRDSPEPPRGILEDAYAFPNSYRSTL